MPALKQYVGGAIAAAAFITIGSLLSQNDLTAAPPSKSAAGRTYYLTQAGFTGNQVLTACTAGYHMASWAELRDLSNLSYNASLGLTTADSGSGPPAVALGWIRTGHPSANQEGVGSNCAVTEEAAWVSSEDTHYGTTMLFGLGAIQDNEPHLRLVHAGQVFVPRQCSTAQSVWCVQD